MFCVPVPFFCSRSNQTCFLTSKKINGDTRTGPTCHLLLSPDVRYTSLTTTISHDNNNHRTSKHASTSWRSDGSPSCLGGSSHGWVPVKTHSTPVPLRWGGCGLLTGTPTHNNEPKKTQHNNNMVAERVLCDLSVRRSVCVHGVCRCS